MIEAKVTTWKIAIENKLRELKADVRSREIALYQGTIDPERLKDTSDQESSR